MTTFSPKTLRHDLLACTGSLTSGSSVPHTLSLSTDHAKDLCDAVGRKPLSYWIEVAHRAENFKLSGVRLRSVNIDSLERRKNLWERRSMLVDLRVVVQ